MLVGTTQTLLDKNYTFTRTQVLCLFNKYIIRKYIHEPLCTQIEFKCIHDVCTQSVDLTRLHEHKFFVLFNMLRALPTCCIMINFPTPKQ